MNKFLKLFIKNFTDKKIMDLATNLTYVSFLSIFPTVAVILGLSKGFGLDLLLVNKIKLTIPTTEKQLNYIISVAEKMIKALNSSILSGVGLIVIIYAVINLLSILENSINLLWNVKKTREFSRRLINYIAIIFLVPITLIFLIGTNDKILELLYRFSNIGIITVIIMNILKIGVFIAILFFIYYAVPNTYVSVKSSLISSSTVVITLLILSNFYTLIQQSISRYNAIYGSLAFVPLFLVWIRYLWIIVLLGVRLNYYLDNRMIIMNVNMNIKNQKKLCILVYALIVSNFNKGNTPLSAKAISERLSVKRPYVIKALEILEQMGYIVKLMNRYIVYQVNKDPSDIKIKEILDKFEEKDCADIFIENDIQYNENMYIKDVKL